LRWFSTILPSQAQSSRAVEGVVSALCAVASYRTPLRFLDSL